MSNEIKKYIIDDEGLNKLVSFSREFVDDFYSLYEKLVGVSCFISCYYNCEIDVDRQFIISCLYDYIQQLCECANIIRESVEEFSQQRETFL